jgi:hypothetical protein
MGAWSGGKKWPAAKEMQRLYGNSVTALAILTEAMAVWLHSARNPSILPDDLRLTYAMSLAILALAPKTTKPSPGSPGKTYQQRPSAAARRETGEHLRRGLAPFFVNLLSTFRHVEKAAVNRHAALQIPFIQQGTCT